MNGLILFGGPAAGKDTVTTALGLLEPRVQLYQRIKVGPGRRQGYRMSTIPAVEQLRSAGLVLWENERYGATYVVEQAGLAEMIRNNLIPVVHLGQREAVAAIERGMPAVDWMVVELWCPIPVARQRIEARETGDTDARLQAWTQTGRLTDPDLVIDTSTTTAADAARLILENAQWTSLSSSQR
ncbi:kinase [Nocardia gipuzkoensis]